MRKTLSLFCFLTIIYSFSWANTFASDSESTQYDRIYSEAEMFAEKGDVLNAEKKTYEYLGFAWIYGCKWYILLQKILPQEEKEYNRLYKICQSTRSSDINNEIFQIESNKFSGINWKYLSHYLYFSLISRISYIEKSFQYNNYSLLQSFSQDKNNFSFTFYKDISLFLSYLEKDKKSYGEKLAMYINQNKDFPLISVYLLLDNFLDEFPNFQDWERLLGLPEIKIYWFDSKIETYRYLAKVKPTEKSDFIKYINFYKKLKSSVWELVLYSDILLTFKPVKNIDSYKSNFIELWWEDYFTFVKNFLEIRNFLYEEDTKLLGSEIYKNIQSSAIFILSYYMEHKREIDLWFSPWNYLYTQIYPIFSKLLYLRDKWIVKIEDSTLEAVFNNKTFLEDALFQIYKDDTGKIVFNPMNEQDKANYLAWMKKKELAEKYNKFYSGAIWSGTEVPNPYIVKDTIPEALDIKVVKKEINDVQSQKNKYYFFLFLSFIWWIIALWMMLRTKNS